MQDLSKLLPSDPVTALAPTSQAGGNMMSSAKFALTAPGSPPTDPLPPAAKQGDPKVTPSNSEQIPPGTDGKPKARTTWNAPRPAWTTTTTPDVIRKPV